MALVSVAATKAGRHDPSIDQLTMRFIWKLNDNDAQKGLNIEPIKNSIDKRVRTGRVNKFYRAVLFKVKGAGDTAHYVLTGVWPHDEAISIARRARLGSNPVNGTTEVTVEPEVDPPPVIVDPPIVQAGDGEAGPSWLESVSAGTTVDTLVGVLGIAPQLAAAAMAATTVDAIIELAADAVEWQGMALLDLGAGNTIYDVRTSLGFDQHAPTHESVDEDQRILDGLKTPAAQLQFAWIEDEDELRQAIEAGDFAKWRTFLHPEQRRYAESSWRGSFRLTGGAGTGKTVVLLHRARMLARRNPEARVVLTTFTRNLADDLRRNLKLLEPGLPLAKSLGDAGIFVTGLDAAANGVLNSSSSAELSAAVERVLGVGGNDAGHRPAEKASGWRKAVEAAGAGLAPELRTESFLASEHTLVVLPARITTREEYLKVRRPGRGVALNRAQRDAVWDVISNYRAAAAVDGVVDFPEVVAIAAAQLDSSEIRPADHVLVDEGQDLAPAQWQFVRALAAEGPDDLFIAEDSQQRIYGQRVMLSRCGIKIVGRSRRLSLNYRTTQQVLRFATGILEGAPTVDLEDEVTDGSGYRSARSGPIPTRIATSSLADELTEAASRVSAWLEAGVVPETIGILARDQRSADQVARGLKDRGVKVQQITRMSAKAKSPQVMTMHRAKGMEFSRVLIFGADADQVPASYLLKSVPEGDRADLLQRERSLFYVAATRARDELVVMWSGKASAFLDS